MKSFKLLPSMFIVLFFVICSCSSTRNAENSISRHFDDINFRVYNSSQSSLPINKGNLVFGEGEVGKEGKERIYKYVIVLDRLNGFSDIYFGAKGSNGGDVVFLTIDETKDRLKKCSEQNKDKPAKDLFACFDGVMEIAAEDCENAKEEGIDVDSQCWWE